MRLLLAAILTLLSLSARAGVDVDSAWIRATVPGQKVGVVYLNLTASADTRLTGGDCSLARRVEIHEMGMRDNIMHMRELSDGLALPAGHTVKLEPGGIHLMLIGLRRALKAGDRVPLTLYFQASDGQRAQLRLKVPVRALVGE